MFILSEDLLKLGKEKADFIVYLLSIHKDKRATAIAKQYYEHINRDIDKGDMLGSFYIEHLIDLINDPNTIYQWKKQLTYSNIDIDFPDVIDKLGLIKVTGRNNYVYEGVGRIYINPIKTIAISLSYDERKQLCFPVWELNDSIESIEYIVEPKSK